MKIQRLLAVLVMGLLVLIGIKLNLPSHIHGGPAIAAAANSEQSSQDQDVIIIDNQDYKSKRRGPVAFTHLKHAKEYKVSCWDCHHEFDDSVNVWTPWSETEKCASCHEPGRGEDIIGLQKAYHMNCRNCHQELADQKMKSGPYRGCFGCHEREM